MSVTCGRHAALRRPRLTPTTRPEPSGLCAAMRIPSGLLHTFAVSAGVRTLCSKNISRTVVCSTISHDFHDYPVKTRRFGTVRVAHGVYGVVDDCTSCWAPAAGVHSMTIGRALLGNE
jgi:hypothetical protein